MLRGIMNYELPAAVPRRRGFAIRTIAISHRLPIGASGKCIYFFSKMYILFR
jgi:hypothetical protein